MKHFTGLMALIFVMAVSLSSEAETVNRVVAVVNDEVITQQDVNQLLAVIYAQYVRAFKKDELLQKMEELKTNVLKQMVEDKLILSRAKELNIQVTEKEIEEKLEYIKSGFPSEEEFYGMLETQGITIGNLKDRYRDQIMVKKVVDFEIRSKIAILPSETSRYYEIHRPEFKIDERRKVRHILIKAEDDVGFELAKVEIDAVYERLREGQDFGELAKQYSQGSDKESGGDMGYVRGGEMLEELDEAIFSLDAGEFSSPIKSKIGYHILKVEDISHSGYLGLGDVQGDIKKILFQNKLKEKLEIWLAELRSKAYISLK